MRKILMILVIKVSFVGIIFAQNQVITGSVIDDKGNPISDATVTIKGTNIAVKCSNDGKFNLEVPQTSKAIIISAIGYSEKEIYLTNDTNYTITLQSANTSLEEVVVLAYGTARRSQYTGSAVTINNKEFAQRPVTNVINAIAGSGPGIQTSGSGQPGDALNIRIRGYGSLSASNSPLIVVDGSPLEANIDQSNFGGALASINPADVESVTVLKDASSTALYGSRAANGVILITTKNGSQRKPTLGITMSSGIVSRQIKEYELTNQQDYYVLMWEALKNSRISGSSASAPDVAARYATANIAGSSWLKYNPFDVPANQIVDTLGKFNTNAKLLWADDLDWTKGITRKGKRSDYGISYSGGNSTSDYFGSVGYTSEDGYVIDAFLKRYSARVKANTRPVKWLKTGINAAYSYTNSNSSTAYSDNATAFVNPFFFARTVAPIYPVHAHNITTGAYLLDENGNQIYDYGSDMVIGNRPSAAYGGRHIVAETQWNKGLAIGSLFEGRTYLDFFLLQGLNFTVNFGGDVLARNSFSYQNKLVGDGAPAGILDKSQWQRKTYTFNQLLNYKRNINNHNFGVLVGHENYDYEYIRTDQQKQDESFEGVYELDNFFTMNFMTSVTDRRRIESYFSTANYDYKGKYLLSASLRRDGNSRFAKDVRWQSFYGIGFGWQVSNEEFIKNVTWINSLKLRASYGSVGNDDIRSQTDDRVLVNYAYQALYELGYTNAGSEGGALLQTAKPNPSVTWEENLTFDIGTDFSLFSNRVNGTVEWFSRNTNRMLFNYQFPLSSGGNVDGGFSEYKNIGSMKNTGLELDLRFDVIRNENLRWNIGLNTSVLKNRITAMPSNTPSIVSGTKKYEVGHSIYDYWLREWLGVDAQTGNALYRANNTSVLNAVTFVRNAGDTVTTNRNNAKFFYAGTAIPDFFGGFSTSVRYKSIELLARFKYQLGGKTYDGAYAQLMHSGNYGASLHSDMLNRWQKPGDITDVPRMDNNKLTDFGAATSSRWLADASFLNIENVTLSYDFNSGVLSKIGASASKLYLSGDNLGFLVSRKGMNPNQGFNGLTSNVYMPARVISAGINVNF